MLSCSTHTSPTTAKRQHYSEFAQGYPCMEEIPCAPLARTTKRVLITGASGLLGRQVLRRLDENGWEVRGLAWSRGCGKLVRCDLTQEGAVDKQIAEFRPDVVIHAASERRPNVVAKQPGETHVVNVDVTQAIAQACRTFGVWLIYISTDYVFDGTQPPYFTDATPNPLSVYGMQKWEGERLALQECSSAAVLRVPLLYGQMEYMKESGVTALYEDLKGGLLKKADHVQKRYPTYTHDVAKVIEKMVEVHSSGRPVQGIFHWQGAECLTKYDMAQALAQINHLDASAVAADMSAPKFPRPEDSRLDCSRLIQELGMERKHFETPFRVALRASFLQYATDKAEATDNALRQLRKTLAQSMASKVSMEPIGDTETRSNLDSIDSIDDSIQSVDSFDSVRGTTWAQKVAPMADATDNASRAAVAA